MSGLSRLRKAQAFLFLSCTCKDFFSSFLFLLLFPPSSFFLPFPSSFSFPFYISCGVRKLRSSNF